MKGGKPIEVISQAWSVPIKSPTTRVPRIAMEETQSGSGSAFFISCGARTTMMVAQTAPLKAIVEPAERSIPPAMITTVAPKAKMPR
jgi:hypothetical protein